MSDLSRLRKQLASAERSGKRLKAEKIELENEIANHFGVATRSEEKQLLWLDKLIGEKRRDWRRIHNELEAEERRLLDPAAKLAFY